MSLNDDTRYYREPPKQLHPLVYVLRKRRYEMGIAAKEVAARSGYSLSVVQQWERGHTTPTLRSISDWAEALGLKLEIRE